MEGGRSGEGETLLPVKYSDEIVARAVELVLDAQAEPATAEGANFSRVEFVI